MPIMPILLKKIKEEYHRTLLKSKGAKADKLYILLYKMLSKMVIKMEIPENSILPATRVLSVELGLSRSTVLRAYDMLVLDGLLITKRSSGYQVKNPKCRMKQRSFNYQKLANPF
jgi:GntR family transcriptional regulator/MocR family aminotransferase